MRKFLAVVLAVSIVLSSTIVASARDVIFSDYKIGTTPFSDFYAKYDTGNGNYVFPLSVFPVRDDRQMNIIYDFFSEYNKLNFSDPDPNNSNTYIFLFAFKSFTVLKFSSFPSVVIDGSSHEFSRDGYLFGCSFSGDPLKLYIMGASTHFYTPSNPDFRVLYSPYNPSNGSFPSYAPVATDIKSIYFDISGYHRLIVNYSFENGNVACESVSKILEISSEYNIPSPEIEGYTPNISCVSGIMPNEDLTIDVVYSSINSSHNLTINYLYSENNFAADPVTQSIEAGAEYSIPSPEIEGYTPSIPIVTGTMPNEDLTIDVYYSKSFYPLTVKYQYQDGSQAAEDVVYQYPAGFAYDVPSPEIAGYQPDKQTVAGTMPGHALEDLVTYRPVEYDLTVYYRHQDGSQAATTYQEQLPAGAAYSVTSPVLAGYKPDKETVSGTMPDKDVYFTVTYTPDGSGGGDGSGGEGEGPGGEGEGPGDGGSGDGGPGDGGFTGNDPFDTLHPPPFSGDDPFRIPGLPEHSGSDPFGMQIPDYSGLDPFHIRVPEYSGSDPFGISTPGYNNDPFKISGLPGYSYDPFIMPDDWKVEG